MQHLYCQISLFFLFFFVHPIAHSQDFDTLKVMSYNLLKFPGVNPERISKLKTIVQHELPDVLIVCELTNGAGADNILYNALNEDEIDFYDMADYVPGPDTQNELYYNTDKLGLKEQNVIETDLRDINEYVLFYKTEDLAYRDDTIFLYAYACHLKASSGFEAERNAELITFKSYLDTRANAENIILAGDFNFYGSAIEPGWNTALNGGHVPLFDPLAAPGNWHNNSDFSWLHTQSTRTTDIDGGAYGGMDDRFDIILVGEDIMSGANNLYYIPESYHAMGQDGVRFNKSLINSPINTEEPEDVIESLYWMSDHLPVRMDILVNTGHLSTPNDKENISNTIYYDAENQILRFDFDEKDTEMVLYRIDGTLIDTIQISPSSNSHDLKGFNPGTYIVKWSSNQSFKFVKPE